MLEAQTLTEAADSSLEVRVVGLSGSLRSPSVTRMAVQYALKGAQEEGAKVEILDLASRNLPFWGLEREEANVKAVGRFRDDLRQSDGIILGSPEIHGSISGVLKNALDLTGTEEFEGKMIGLIGVAGGRMGAVEALSHMRAIGRSLHAWVVPAQVSIGDSAQVFKLNGEPIDPEIGDRLKSVGREVAHFARLHKCENHTQFLKEWETHALMPKTGPTMQSPVSETYA
jgi:NAD(P)H-dependent FMN reductase